MPTPSQVAVAPSRHYGIYYSQRTTLVYAIVKRILDLAVALIALIPLAPIMAVIAILVKRDSIGPALYRGERAGRNGKPFEMLKFRTMVVNADSIGGPSTSADDSRITRVGHRLRRYKLDELPQLINVLKGEMSLVGPRPEVMSEVRTYTAEERKLLSVPPGITDWASLRFSDEGAILEGAADPHQVYLEKIRPEKVRLGLEYVQHRSLLVDLRVLADTAMVLLRTRTRLG